MLTISDKPHRVAFYIRVSTEEQKNGYWPEMQLQWLQEMIVFRGKHNNWIHNPEWVYQDLGKTGADLNRPQYKKMIEDAMLGKFDMVAVWKIDRLSRNLSHLLSTFEILQKNKVWFFSLKENIDFTGPIGKLTFQIFWALAEFERETIKTRTKEWKLASARLGNYVLSTTPFGYIKDKSDKREWRSLIVIPEEAIWVKRIFSEFLSGKTYQEIANILTENKVDKGKGNTRENKAKIWYHTDIRNILERGAYTGRAVYKSKDEKWNETQVPIEVPRIIDDLTFELAKNLIKESEEDPVRWGGNVEYLLSRKVTDLETGRKFVWVSRTKGGISYRRPARTIRGKYYKNFDIPWLSLEELVWEHIETFIKRPQELYDIFRKQSVDSRDYDTYTKERERRQIELERLEDADLSTELDYRKGMLSEEKYEKVLAKISQDREACEKQIQDLDEKLDGIVQAEEMKISLEEFSKTIETKIENLSFSQKKQIINILVRDIVVTRENLRPVIAINYRFQPSKVWLSIDEYEPKKSSPEPKNGTEEPSMSWNGATDRTWTCDLLLRREAF